MSIATYEHHKISLVIDEVIIKGKWQHLPVPSLQLSFCKLKFKATKLCALVKEISALSHPAVKC